jgi:hypothetical protein
MVLASPVSAQAPAAFDGEYSGTATRGAGRGRATPYCAGDFALQMTIAASRVTGHGVGANGRPGRAYTGTVDPSGKVSVSAQYNVNPASPQGTGYVVLSGSIAGDKFTGTIDSSRCHWDVSVAKK